MSSNDPVYIIDGSGYIFRAFYAVPHLSRSDGFPTNALFGFTRMILKLLGEARPERCALVFDAGRETFRNKMYPEYKAQRGQCPDELVPQMPYFREVGAILGLPTLELSGYEADDIIATLTRECTRRGHEVVIITADKDLMQLVGDHVSLWDTMRDKRSGLQEVEDKFGVGPEYVPDILGLIGDASDNIPGLNGVGPKTAAQLVSKFGKVEDILNSIEQIVACSEIRGRKKIAEALQTEADIVRLSKQLATVVDTIPLPDLRKALAKNCPEPHRKNDEEEIDLLLVRRPVDTIVLQEFIDRFEFAKLFEGIDPKVLGTSEEARDRRDSAAQHQVVYRTVLRDEFFEWVTLFQSQPVFSFDLETTSLDVLKAEIVGVSICWSDHEAFYIPLNHVTSAGEGKTAERISEQVSFEEFLGGCRDRFLDPEVLIRGHNLKYDIGVFAQHGIPIQGKIFDTMVAAYLLNPDARRYSLEVLGAEILGRTVSTYKEVTAGVASFAEVTIDAATKYSGEDSHIAWLLAEHLQQRLVDLDLMSLAEDIEMPLVPVLSCIERKGILLDIPFLAQLSHDLENDIRLLQRRIFEVAGEEFNMNSPKQLSHILFDKLGVSTKGLKRTKTGISTNSAVLERLSAVHPLPQCILDYRSLQKLKGTYVDALPVQVSNLSGRLHTSLNQTVTGTGRLSSSDPNLQNIPLRTERGSSIRAAFVSGPGNVIISADYSQIELRVLAHLSGDEALIDAFKQDRDIHEKTAREILNIPAGSPVSSEQRRLGKTINFGVVYGMSSFRLSRDLGITVQEAQNHIDAYFNEFPGVRDLFASLGERAETSGEVRTLYGRRRVLSAIDTGDRDKGFVMRAALNAPIQGTAADLIKRAMIRIQHRIGSEQVPICMLLQIHDELLFEAPADLQNYAVELIKYEMEHIAELLVPLRVEIGTGRNWLEAH
jgi:DNA polymerase I